MKRIFSLMFIFFALFCSACSESKELKSNASVEVIDGIEYIHNTETPIHPDKTVLFEKDLSIRSEDEEGNIVLFKPLFFQVDRDENIFISEAGEQEIKVFDSDGKYIKTIGARGNGPGEFQNIGAIGFTPEGNFVVMDLRSRRTNLFDATGQFLKSFTWRKYFRIFHLFKNDSYICQDNVRGKNPQDRKLFVKEFDYDGNEIKSYGEFTLAKMKRATKGDSSFILPIPYSPRSIFAGDQNRGWLYHCINNKYSIEVYDDSGKMFRKIDRPYDSVPFTDKDRKEFLEGFENDSLEMYKKMAKEMELPKVKTISSQMFVDDKGYLWIQTYEQKKEGNQTLTAYDIFNSEGHYYARVWCEIVSGIFSKGKMYSMETDEETGYRTLTRYRVVWN